MLHSPANNWASMGSNHVLAAYKPRDSELGHLRDFLLRPLEISAHLAGILHAVSEASPCLGEPSLSFCLQFHEFSLLGIEMPRPVSLREQNFLKVKDKAQV